MTYYVLEYLKLIQDFIFQQARGSAQPHVYPRDLEILKLVVPNKKVIQDYEKIVEPINQKISNNLKQNQELAALRDWLLPMLMNGQVTSPLRQAQGSATEVGNKDYKTETTYAQAAEEREEYGE